MQIQLASSLAFDWSEPTMHARHPTFAGWIRGSLGWLAELPGNPRVVAAARAGSVVAAVAAVIVSDYVCLRGAASAWARYLVVDVPSFVFWTNFAAVVAALQTPVWFSDLGTPFPFGRIVGICIGFPAVAALALVIATNVRKPAGAVPPRRGATPSSAGSLG